jgi:uracil-DNA glycosylase family 4
MGRLSTNSSRRGITKILFVGSNPSVAGSLAPFVGTRSYSVLEGWVSKLGVDAKFYAVNAFDGVTPNNKAPTTKQVTGSTLSLRKKIYAVDPDLVVALGRVAERAVREAEVPVYFKMDHPSGLNRKLNDESYVSEMLGYLREAIVGAR